MRRTGRVLAIVAVAMFVAAIPAMAQKPHSPPPVGQVYNIADLWEDVPDRVLPLPNPGPGTGGAAPVVPKQNGPVLVESSMSAAPVASPRLGGSAIPGMGAGAILTPMERTGLEIKRLIRQLG